VARSSAIPTWANLLAATTIILMAMTESYYVMGLCSS
jgi:hypothetical protein